MLRPKKINPAHVVIGLGVVALVTGGLLMIHALGNVYSLPGHCLTNTNCNSQLNNDRSLVSRGHALIYGGLIVIGLGGILLRYLEIRAGKK